MERIINLMSLVTNTAKKTFFSLHDTCITLLPTKKKKNIIMCPCMEFPKSDPAKAC